MDQYLPVNHPSQLYDETLDKMIKNREKNKVYLVSMPQSVSLRDLPTSIQMNPEGNPALASSSNNDNRGKKSQYYLKEAPTEIKEHLRRSHCLWTVVQGTAAPAPGKAVRISKDSRMFDGVWQVLLQESL